MGEPAPAETESPVATPSSSNELRPAEPAVTARRAVIEVLLVFFVFFVHAGGAVPDVNEPHYLGKAKHYWNSDWCAGDMFLESADAHQTFYWSIGWLTLLMPLTAVAWTGRIITWLLLAWAWRRLSFALVPKPLAAVLSAALFVSLLHRFNFAGEWVVGGLEAKGFAYALVLLGLEALVRDRWNRCWLLFGGAAAFHVLVGGWAVLAGMVAWISGGRARPGVRSMLPGLAGGFTLSLLGVLPGLWLTWGVDPELVAEANRIQVFERLKHHLALHRLDTAELLPRAANTIGMLAAFGLLVWLVPADRRLRRLRNFVVATILFALCGLAISFATQHHERLAAAILRFYWYRLYDVSLPLGVSLFATALVVRWIEVRPAVGTMALLLALVIPVWHLGDLVYRRHALRHGPADLKMAGPEGKATDDWLDVCDWVREHTPADARFIVPRKSHTFKWHAERSEVVTNKDMPQDAASVVEWQRRIDTFFPLHVIDAEPQRVSLWKLDPQKFVKEAAAVGAGWLIVGNPAVNPEVNNPEMKSTAKADTTTKGPAAPSPAAIAAALNTPPPFQLYYHNPSFSVYRLPPAP